MTISHLRRCAAEQGYRIKKSGDGYTLIDNRLGAVVYHFADVPLEDIASFFEVELIVGRGSPLEIRLAAPATAHTQDRHSVFNT